MVNSRCQLHNISPQLHIFRYDDKFFMFDVSTSTAFEIDDLAFGILESLYIANEGDSIYWKYSEEDILKVNDELGKLISQGYFSNEKRPAINSNGEINTIELNVIQACNMNCVYCYEDGGSYGINEKIMSLEVAKKTVDFLLENSGQAKTVYIQFFGGEPLMNFALIKETVEYANERCTKYEKQVSFGMTTNGTLLNSDVVRFCNLNGIRMTISMDGGKEEQDYLRPLKNKHSSYDAMVPNITFFNKTRRNNSVRMTVTKKNIDIISCIANFRALGFKRYNFAIAEIDREDLKLDKSDFDKLNEQYKIITRKVLTDITGKKGRRLMEVIPEGSLYSAVTKLYSASRRGYPCGAGKNMLCVSPDGHLYLCHRFGESEEFRLGDIYKGIDNEKRQRFVKSYVEHDKDCRNCWLRNLCAGGCMHSRLDQKNKLIKKDLNRKEFCHHQRYIYELAVVIYNQIAEYDDELFKSIGGIESEGRYFNQSKKH